MLLHLHVTSERRAAKQDQSPTMICACARLPDYDYCKPGRSLSKTIRPLLGKAIVAKNFRELFKCQVCSTYWRIDTPDKYHERFAWKVGAFRDDWAEVDKPDEEKSLLLKYRGGLTEEVCIWADCGKRRVKGVAYCIDHLYATGARR